MAAEAKRSRARRAGGLVALLLAVLIAPVLAAPGVPATCSKVLDLAAVAGESIGDEEREACERHYDRLRASRGVLGWTRLSWCTRVARSIPEAGQC
jgi:hypothetical protein